MAPLVSIPDMHFQHLQSVVGRAQIRSEIHYLAHSVFGPWEHRLLAQVCPKEVTFEGSLGQAKEMKFAKTQTRQREEPDAVDTEQEPLPVSSPAGGGHRADKPKRV